MFRRSKKRVSSLPSIVALQFFNESGSRVVCLKQSREPKSDLSGGGGGGGGLLCTIGEGVNSMLGAINKEVAPRLLYTHHQKTVVVDDPNTHQMVAFVGGLDLTQVLILRVQYSQDCGGS